MAAPTVLASVLISRAREAADMPVAGFVADSATGIYGWLNEGCQLLHEKLIAAYADNYVVNVAPQVNIVAGTELYALPDDFFKLLGIDVQLNGVWRNLKPYTYAERNTFRNALSTWTGAPRYRVVGSNVSILPATYSAPMLIRYAPIFSIGASGTATLLSTGTDAVSFPNGWERYVVAYTAMRMRMKEESDTRELAALIAKWDAELEEIAQNRDLGAPKQAVDTDNIDVIWIL